MTAKPLPSPSFFLGDIMTKKPESRRQLNIRHKLEAFYPGSKWVKLHGGPFQDAGLLDLLGCVEGLYISLEIKEPNKPPASAIQEATAKQYRAAGGCAEIGIETVEQAIKAIEAHRERFRKA